MTDQSKIPLPDESTGESLIERAVSAFDLRSFAPAAVPENLAPARVKPVARVQAKPAPAPALASLPVEAASTEAREVEQPVAPIEAPEPIQAPAVFLAAPLAVDRQHLREQGMILPDGPVSGLLEEFRIVKRQLLAQAAELRASGAGLPAQRVLICSPHPEEGKTFSAVNLALAIAAEKESEVLLVDADFGKPSVLKALGLPDSRGLMDALADATADAADFVVTTDIPGLFVLPAGSATNSDSEYLSSSRTRRVLDRLSEGAPHRMVIFDSPPALAASPAAELAKYVGQALVIVRADRTGQGSLDDAISLLSACPNIQLLLNAVQFSPSGRRFGSYYGYGEK